MSSSIWFWLLALERWAGVVNAAEQNLTSTHTLVNPTSATPSITKPPSIPAITLLPLPPEFDDIPKDVRECYDSWASVHAHDVFIEGEVGRLASTAKLDPPTTVLERTSAFENYVCSTSLLPGKYTTLCDGLPRNMQRSEAVSCGNIWSTYNKTISISSTTIVPEWLSRWKASNKIPLPSCLQSLDRQSACYRLHSAYSWRTEQAKSSEKANITQLPMSLMIAEKPACRTLKDPPPSNWTMRPCHLDVKNYQLYYWPSATLTGSSLCLPNVTRLPGGTRTIPWLPNTAVVSGFTLTSPSVYHFMTGVKISTSIGRERQGRLMSPVWNLSTSIDSTSILTFPQEESEIWTVRSHRSGHGIHAHIDFDYYNGSYNADDTETVRSADYFGECPHSKTCNHTGETISQAHFTQRAAIDIRDMLNEWGSDEFQDCDWGQQNYVPSFHNKSGMWIAPGEPWRATPIVTNDKDEVEATMMAKPASTVHSPITQTANWTPDVRETGEPRYKPDEYIY